MPSPADPDGQLLAHEPDAAPAGLPADKQLRERLALLAACRAAQAAVLAAEEESRDLLQLAQRQEQGDALFTPHFDAARTRVGMPWREPGGACAAPGMLCLGLLVLCLVAWLHAIATKSSVG